MVLGLKLVHWCIDERAEGPKNLVAGKWIQEVLFFLCIWPFRIDSGYQTSRHQCDDDLNDRKSRNDLAFIETLG